MSYVENSLIQRERDITLQRLVSLIQLWEMRHENNTFDTIIVRGVSGMALGPTVAQILNKKLCIIRKEDGAHSASIFEGEVGTAGIIIDDLISTGSTMDIILTKLKTFALECEVKAIFLWLVSDFERPGFNWYKEDFDEVKLSIPIYGFRHSSEWAGRFGNILTEDCLKLNNNARILVGLEPLCVSSSSF